MSDTPTRLAENMRRLAGLVDENLRALCSHCPSDVPPRLWDSVTYSLLAGGKRLRPVLCLAAAEMLSVPPARVMPMALALEMIHTASLIHDDLPAMDDDTATTVRELVTKGAVAGSISRAQLIEIAEKKMKDLNANDVDAAAKIIEGSARSMGLEIVEA